MIVIAILEECFKTCSILFWIPYIVTFLCISYSNDVPNYPNNDQASYDPHANNFPEHISTTAQYVSGAYKRYVTCISIDESLKNTCIVVTDLKVTISEPALWKSQTKWTLTSTKEAAQKYIYVKNIGFY